MDYYALPISNLIQELAGLPGIGRKTAQRLAFYILEMESIEVEKLVTAIIEAKEKKFIIAKKCCNLTDEELCSICGGDNRRDGSIICVVEGAKDIVAMEKLENIRAYTMYFMAPYLLWKI